MAQQRGPPAATPSTWMVVWVAVSTGWLVGFTDGDSALFIRGFSDRFFPHLRIGLGLGNPQDRQVTGMQPFCTFLRADLQLYLALPHLAAACGALTAAHLSHRRGRKPSVWLGCSMSALAKVLLVFAHSSAQVWAARICTGFATGLLHQAPLLEVLELVPFTRRGALAACQNLGRAVGFLCSALLTYGLDLEQRSWQWRLVPIFGIWPALVTAVLLLLLPETPSSLLQRGKLAEARIALQRLRGMLQNTEQEYADILKASRLFSTAGSQLQALKQQREAQLALYAGLGLVTVASATGGALLVSSAFPVFYALGYGRLKGYTMSMVMIACGTVLGGVLAVLAADSLGRRRGTTAGGLLSAACYIAVALIIKLVYFEAGKAERLAAGWAWAVGALISLACGLDFAANTLLWVFAFEVQPLPTRSLATGMVTAWHSLQAFGWMLATLPLLCQLQGWGMFLLFAIASISTAVAAWLFMVPTTSIPLDLLDTLWAKHWFWRRYCCSSVAASAHSRSRALSSELGSLPLSPWSVRPGSNPASTEQMLQQLAYLHLARPPDTPQDQQQQQQQQQQAQQESAAGSPAPGLHSPAHASEARTARSPSCSSTASTGGSSSAQQQPSRPLLVDAAMFKQLAMHSTTNAAAAGSTTAVSSLTSTVATALQPAAAAAASVPARRQCQ
ncbi:hypothetical protein COO60DRAFT_310678 [Scenedesmus sp. NREL 46B-D3]|nr:hypothetical protein COO60DRAFT_310678 [Scenedesmus sp. NREL 46B-D3]